MRTLEVAVLYNEPTLPPDDPDWASEAGVLESVEAVCQALDARGHRTRPVAVGSTPEHGLRAIRGLGAADVVFNLFEGFGGVGRGEAELAGMIELLGYPLTGSSAGALELVRDKPRTKWLLTGAGLPTAEFETVDARSQPRERALRALLERGPLIVKPAHEDASLGISSTSIVTDYAALLDQIERVRRRYGEALVERFIVGREFNAALIALPEAELLPLAEIEFSGDAPPGWQIVTYDAKWAIGSAADLQTPACCPAKVSEALAARIGQVALAAFRLTGCRDFARVDLRVDEQEQIHLLEVNANPDIGPGAGFARALRARALDYAEFVDRVVRTAIARRAKSAGD